MRAQELSWYAGGVELFGLLPTVTSTDVTDM